MKQWLWKQVVASEYDTSAAIDRATEHFDELDDVERRIVIRAGMGRLIPAEVKTRKLRIPRNGGPAETMPLFASVELDGRHVRVNYLLTNIQQLRAILERERKTRRRASIRVARLQYDVRLYERHPDLPTLRDVWDVEHVSYVLDKAA